MDQVRSTLASPTIFKYGKWRLAIAWPLFVAMGILTIFMINERYESASRVSISGVVIFSILTVFIGFISVIATLGSLDIFIDDQCICRQLFSMTLQTIRWDNIRLITAFPVSGGHGYTARAFNIFPIIKPRFGLQPSGKIFFDDKLENAPELVDLLNHYVSKHGIKIEIRDTLLGNLTSATRL
ncbi:MAG TPA: hypothetical protein VIF82_05405 [Burkholderiaceae bacterium]